MLPADLVRARRRADRLTVSAVKGTERQEIESIAADILDVLAGCQDETLDEVNAALSAVPRSARHEKVWAALKKLALDACEFGAPVEVDAAALRKDVFELASRMRRAAARDRPFDRDDVLRQVGETYGLSAGDVEEGLFGDLKGAARLGKAAAMTPGTLLEEYELAQIQGVLLRAVHLVVVADCSSPDQARRLFQKLKFRQLLHRLQKVGASSYRIEIEGPFSLFESVTKYGLQLALLVPDLKQCRQAELEAELRWGKDRRKLRFSTTLTGGQNGGGPAVRSDVLALLESIEKRQTTWSARISSEMFDVPGVGLCVPDIQLTADGREPVFVEVLGYWSREAVWKRVEWAQSQRDKRVIFAVSNRLRVSQEVLPTETGSALFVYKGTISAAKLLAQADELSSLSSS